MSFICLSFCIFVLFFNGCAKLSDTQESSDKTQVEGTADTSEDSGDGKIETEIIGEGEDQEEDERGGESPEEESSEPDSDEEAEKAAEEDAARIAAEEEAQRIRSRRSNPYDKHR